MQFSLLKTQIINSTYPIQKEQQTLQTVRLNSFPQAEKVLGTPMQFSLLKTQIINSTYPIQKEQQTLQTVRLNSFPQAEKKNQFTSRQWNLGLCHFTFLLLNSKKSIVNEGSVSHLKKMEGGVFQSKVFYFIRCRSSHLKANIILPFV